MADSFQTSSSSSSSTPTVVNTPQTDWGLQLSKLLSILAQGQYAWAMDQYNKGVAVSDAMIANFMQESGQAAGLARNLIQQYSDQFAPLNAQYIAQANSYNSEARQRFMMGRAESNVNQAMTAGQDEAERKLQSFGINPADGRYQDLINVDRMKKAAAMAGAGTQAALDTADRGRAMTEKAIQFGQNVPGMATNALNTALQGITGAQNANLGQQNAGATLSQTAAPFFNASAAANKTPPVGQTSSSGQSSSGRSSSPDHDTSGGQNRQGGQGSGNGGGNSGGGGSPGNGPINSTVGGVRIPGLNPGGGAAIQPVPDNGYGAGDSSYGEDPWEGGGTDWSDPDLTGIGQGDQQQNNEFGDFDPQGDGGGGSPTDIPGGFGDNSYGDWYTPPGGDTSGDSGFGYNASGADTNSYQDTSFDGGSGYDEEFAEGGPVPTSASPSRGRQTDDISARLNAGEYVIPRDVVAHRGPEYFRSLIDQSRRSRTGVGGPPPKAKLRPALNRAPTFVSR